MSELPEQSVALIVLFLIFLIFFTLKKKNPINSKTLSTFRVLFPSWRFFDQPGIQPQLYYQTNLSSDWILLNQKMNFSYTTFLLNPKGNLAHAKNNLLQHLLIDLNDNLSEPSPTYTLVKTWVLDHLKSTAPLARSFQFKLVTNGDEDLLVSPLYEIQSC